MSELTDRPDLLRRVIEREWIEKLSAKQQRAVCRREFCLIADAFPVCSDGIDLLQNDGTRLRI